MFERLILGFLPRVSRQISLDSRCSILSSKRVCLCFSTSNTSCLHFYFLRMSMCECELFQWKILLSISLPSVLFTIVLIAMTLIDWLIVWFWCPSFVNIIISTWNFSESDFSNTKRIILLGIEFLLTVFHNSLQHWNTPEINLCLKLWFYVIVERSWDFFKISRILLNVRSVEWKKIKLKQQLSWFEVI